VTCSKLHSQQFAVDRKERLSVQMVSRLELPGASAPSFATFSEWRWLPVLYYKWRI